MAHENIQVTADELAQKLLSHGIDIKSHKGGPTLVSRYGWKVVKIDGQTCVAPCDETEFRRMVGAMYTADELKIKLQNVCYQTYPSNCIGATCCQLWYNWQAKAWYCSCP
jgi:hypothetical protein